MLLTDNMWSQWTVVYSVHVSVSVSFDLNAVTVSAPGSLSVIADVDVQC